MVFLCFSMVLGPFLARFLWVSIPLGTFLVPDPTLGVFAYTGKTLQNLHFVEMAAVRVNGTASLSLSAARQRCADNHRPDKPPLRDSAAAHLVYVSNKCSCVIYHKLN